MSKLQHMGYDFIHAPLCHGEFDHFHSLLTDRWTAIGVVASRNLAGGILDIPTAGTDNADAYLHSAHENFLFADNKPISIGFMAKALEGVAVGEGNFCIGLVDGVAADLMQDNGAGPKTTASGMMFEKRDGETVWRTWSSDSTTQESQILTAANLNNLSKKDQTLDDQWHRFDIKFRSESSGRGYITFHLDTVQVTRHLNYDFPNATEMALVMGVKTGAAQIMDLEVDYAGGYQAM
jgi:hypothetical protein